MVEATKRRTGRRSVGRAVKVWMSVDRVGERAYFIGIDWSNANKKWIGTGTAHDQQEVRPPMEELARENCEWTRAHSRLECTHLGEG